MAIELEIIELAGFGSAGDDQLPIARGPILARQRITAAGLSAALNANTRVILLRNHADACHIRLNAGSDATLAAAADTKSLKLRATSDEISFDLDTEMLAGKVDVRAI